MKLSCILLLALIGAVLSYKSYNGYQVLKTREVTSQVLPALMQLKKNSAYDFWTRPVVGKSVLIMSGPENVDILRNALRRLHLEPTVHIPDVGVTLRRERKEIEAIRKTETRSSKAATYDRYMDNDEIMMFVHDTVSANPAIASMIEMGNSTEGRMLHGIKISNGSGRKAVWIDCIVHAREWIAAPVCMKITEDVIASTQLQDLIDWYIVPVTNPDGYAFSWTDDRLWGKTRRPNTGSSCIGSDPNRNYDFNWNGNNNDDFCADDYPGDKALSEPECAAIASNLDSLASSGQLILYLTMHSYGQEILYPYGHTADPAPTAPELQAAGDEASSAIATSRGTVYGVGATGNEELIYGASSDYAYGVLNVPYAYTFELIGGGSSGYNPPASEILPIVTETVLGIVSLVQRAVAASK